MKLKYTPEAIRDLQEIKNYISKTLQNPNVAYRIVKNILDSCGRLKKFPGLGISLMEKTGTETDLRCLVSDNYLVIYRQEHKLILVSRVLDGRTDYIRVLFK